MGDALEHQHLASEVCSAWVDAKSTQAATTRNSFTAKIFSVSKDRVDIAGGLEACSLRGMND